MSLGKVTKAPQNQEKRRYDDACGLAHALELLGVDEGAETPELAAAGLEFALEGLFLNRRISKDDSPAGGILYGS